MQYFTAKAPDGTQLTIRDIEAQDLAAATSIYNHYVEHTVVTFDTELFTTKQREPWLKQFTPGSVHQCLVIEKNGVVLGYASSSRFRLKPAYDQTIEVTIYLSPNAVGLGYGPHLYQQLFSNLSQMNIHRAIAIIALPNPQSQRLHESFGFTSIGTLSEVGYKFNQYHDTLWLEKHFSHS